MNVNATEGGGAIISPATFMAGHFSASEIKEGRFQGIRHYGG